MSINFRKILLAGTALVAASAFSAQAQAAVVAQTLAGAVTWAVDGDQNQAPADGTGAAASDTLALAGFVGTVTNDGTADDGGGLNSFTLGAVTTGTAAGALNILTGSANDLSATVASIVNTTTVAATAISNRDVDNAATAVTITGALSTSGNLTLTNNETSVAKTVTASVGGDLTVATASTITAGGFAGADSTLTLTGATNAFTLGVKLDDTATGNATLLLDGAVAQTMAGIIQGTADGEGTLTSTNTHASGVTFAGVIGGGVLSLETINAGVAGTTTTFNAAATATTTNVTGTGTVAFGAAATTNVAFGANDGVVTIADGSDLTGTVDATTASKGTLTLLGTTTVSGAVGATEKLKVVNAGIAAKVGTFSSTVNAATVNITGTGEAIFNGALTATAVDFGAAGTATLNESATGAFDFVNNAGTITLASGKSITGAVDSTVGANGTLTLAGGAQTVSGIVGGTNALLEVNAGVAAAVSTFSSAVTATTVNITGTGEAIFNGALTATAVDFGAAGTATLNESATGAFDFADNAGTITLASGKSITGAVDSAGGANGTLTLAGGAQTVSGIVGGTNAVATVNAGATGATSTFSSAVTATTLNVTGNGAVALNGNTAGALLFGAASTGTVTVADGVTFTGAMNGTGGVVGTGIGNVVFAGSTTGVTTVGDAGTLQSLTISDGTAQKTVAVGNHLAADTTSLNDNVLAVTGTFGLGVAQTLASTINGTTAATYGNVTSTGIATVAATSLLNLTVDSTVYIPTDTTFTIVGGTGGAAVTALAAGGLTVNGVNSGAGQTVTNGIMTYSQVVDTEKLIIEVTRAATATVATTANGDNVGTVLDTAYFTTDAGAVGNILLVQGNMQDAATAAVLDDVLESVTPTVGGGVLLTALDVGNQVQGINDVRMAALRSDDGMTGVAAGASANGVSMWFQGYGQYATQDTRQGIKGYDADTLGTAIGVDTTTLISDGVLGVSISYGNTDIDGKNVNTTDTELDNYGVTVYGSVGISDKAFLNGQLGYAFNDIDSDRHNVGGVAGLTAHGDYDSNQFSVKAAVGRDHLTSNGTVLTPTVSAAYTYLDTDSYTETGAGALNLTVDNESLNVLALGIGVNASWNLKNSDGTIMKPSLRVGYAYNVLNDKVETTSTFSGVGTAFDTNGADSARSTFNAGAGMTWITAANWDVSASYDFTYKNDYAAHNGILRATSRF